MKLRERAKRLKSDMVLNRVYPGVDKTHDMLYTVI